MPETTLRKITETWGVALDDSVRYHIQGNKGIIEIDLFATEEDIERASVHDAGEDFLSKDELEYYMNLEDK